MDNLLIISYLFPPLGGSGALRPLKLSKLLPNFGWRPIVLTVKNPDWYFALDPELLEQLTSDTIIFRSSMLKSSWIYRGLNPFRFQALERLIADYLIHPDDRVGWLPGAYRKAAEIIGKYDIRAVYSTSGPLTCHIIAYLIKKRFKLPWLAEFRDEWFEDPGLNMPTKLHKRLHYKLEEKIVNTADAIVTMAPEFNRLLGKHTRNREKFYTVTAGYDPDESLCNATYKQSTKKADTFETVFAGVFYDSFRPDTFINAVNSLIDEGTIPKNDVRIVFIGPNSVSDLQAEDCHHICEFPGYLPRRKVLRRVGLADILLLLLSRERGRGVIPSKVFEYMASGKPILALVPKDGEVARIIRRTGTGIVMDFSDFYGIKKVFKELYDDWKKGELSKTTSHLADISKYDQNRITEQFVSVLKRITPQYR